MMKFSLPWIILIIAIIGFIVISCRFCYGVGKLEGYIKANNLCLRRFEITEQYLLGEITKTEAKKVNDSIHFEAIKYFK